MLTKMGAHIEGAGTSTIRVRGVRKLHGTEHAIIPDRIEAGTYVIAGAITGGDVLVNYCEPDHLRALTAKLREAGCDITETDHQAIRVRSTGKLRGVDIVTEEHPGFATDLQAQYMALMTQAEGITFIKENIFENRFMQASELMRMGAQIRLDGRQAIVAGPTQLSGAQVIASDLRASASLVLAGLVAKGETVVDRMYHIDRGYESIEGKLTRIGAKIRRVDDAHERTS
jgi:UDP-N-acetylglucosamine 1-carboxyvinyltransferase